ncbi:MAG: hypothetical protein AB7G15_17135 [Alphaproteobacteria bacterium]
MFRSGSTLLRRRAAYRRLFQSPHGEAVLADLKRFCRAATPTHTPGDPYTTAFLEGRREVWNRIVAHIHWDESRIATLAERRDEDD